MSLDLFNVPPIPFKAPQQPMVGRGLTPRWCQREDVDMLMAAVEKGYQRPACIAATGYGKGFLIAEMAGRLQANGKVVVLVDREHLVMQLAAEIENHLGVDVGMIAGGDAVGLGKSIVVSTVQAMYTADASGKRLYEYPQFDRVKAVIVDECHKFFAPCFRAPIEHFVENSGAVVPIFTATPKAANGAEWATFATWTAPEAGPCMRTTPWCIQNGLLVPMLQAYIGVQLSLSDVTERLSVDSEDDDAGDELSGLLIDLLSDKTERSAAEFASGIAEVIGERQAIIFTPPKVKAAKLLSSWLQSKLNCDAVWGARPDKNDVLARFRRGRPQALTNPNLLCEGYNAPNASAVFICRMIKNWRLVQQMVGRGLRPSDQVVPELGRLDGPENAAARRRAISNSDKPNCLIADLVGLDERIIQSSAVEVLYGEESDDVKHAIGEEMYRRNFNPTDRPPMPDEAALEVAKAVVVKRQNEQLADMARRRGMAGDLNVDVSVSYSGSTVSAPSFPAAKHSASLGEKARFVALAIQYDVGRARAMADKMPRNQLRGMMAGLQKKLAKEGQQPDWGRARRCYPEWANQRRQG